MMITHSYPLIHIHSTVVVVVMVMMMRPGATLHGMYVHPCTDHLLLLRIIIIYNYNY